jgi:hypothetical protein
MVRGILRAVGFVLLAGGFVAAVMDGARSIAASSLALMPTGEALFRLLGERYLLLQPGIERHIHPLLWDPIVLNLTLLPLSAVLLGLAFLFLWLGRRRREPSVGFAVRN